MSDTYATLEQWTSGWRARILLPHTKPYYFVPEPPNLLCTKRDLVQLINRAHPGVTYLSTELFNTKARESNDNNHQQLQSRDTRTGHCRTV